MPTNTYKATAMAIQLQSRLALRLSALTVHAVAYDTDGNPYIAIDDGTPATTEKNAIIKILPDVTVGATDVLGNTAFAYTPHITQLVTEAPAAGSGAGVYLDLQTLSHILDEAMGLGTRFDWYQTANTVVPTPGAGTLKATVYPDLYNPRTNQQ